MTSLFDQLFADARAMLQQQHGSALVWTKAGGAAVPGGTIVVAAAIVGPESSDPRDTDSGTVLYRVRTVELPTADVPRPDRGDTCTIDGVTWSYDRTLGVAGGLAHVQLCRPEQAEIAARGYRSA